MHRAFISAIYAQVEIGGDRLKWSMAEQKKKKSEQKNTTNHKRFCSSLYFFFFFRKSVQSGWVIPASSMPIHYVSNNHLNELLLHSMRCVELKREWKLPISSIVQDYEGENAHNINRIISVALSVTTINIKHIFAFIHAPW